MPLGLHTQTVGDWGYVPCFTFPFTHGSALHAEQQGSMQHWLACLQGSIAAGMGNAQPDGEGTPYVSILGCRAHERGWQSES